MGGGRVLGHDNEDIRICMRTIIRTRRKGRLTSNSVPRHSYRRELGNSFKSCLFPGQDTARKMGTIGEPLLLRRERSGHRPASGAAGAQDATAGRIGDVSGVETRQWDEKHYGGGVR